MLEREERLRLLANGVKRAEERVQVWQAECLKVEPGTLSQKRDALKQAEEWLAVSEELLLLAVAHPEPGEAYKSNLVASLTSRPSLAP